MTDALDALEASFAKQAWFSVLGEPPTDAEAADVAAYLDGLGFGNTGVHWLTGLGDARDAALRSDWDRGWAEAERQAVAGLTVEVDARIGRRAATDRLNRLMARVSSIVVGPAAAAAARFGIADPGLSRAMAGAATQAAFERALVATAGAGRTHPLAIRYRLFAGGRWPLAIAGGVFHII